jgi:hypothetical protein
MNDVEQQPESQAEAPQEVVPLFTVYSDMRVEPIKTDMTTVELMSVLMNLVMGISIRALRQADILHAHDAEVLERHKRQQPPSPP